MVVYSKNKSMKNKIHKKEISSSIERKQLMVLVPIITDRPIQTEDAES